MARAQRKEELLKSELPPALPLMALRSTIVYPLGTIAVQMGAPENLALLRAHEEPGLVVALVVASGDHDEPIDLARFVGRVGVAARVHERINLPGDTVQITLQGLRRIVIDGIEQTEPYPVAACHPAKDVAADANEVTDLIARVASAAETLAEMVDRIPDEVPAILKMNVSDPGRFADLAATNMNFRISDKDEVLQRLDVGQRLRFILSRLEREVARARVMEDVKRQTEIKIEQHQREFYRRGQAAGESRPGSASRNRAHADAVAGVQRVPGGADVPRLGAVAPLEQALRLGGDRPQESAGGAGLAALRSR
jgi:ATP-dependent Lon protease